MIDQARITQILGEVFVLYAAIAAGGANVQADLAAINALLSEYEQLSGKSTIDVAAIAEAAANLVQAHIDSHTTWTDPDLDETPTL